MRDLYEPHPFNGMPGIIGGNCLTCGGSSPEPWHQKYYEANPARRQPITVDITQCGVERWHARSPETGYSAITDSFEDAVLWATTPMTPGDVITLHMRPPQFSGVIPPSKD